MVEPKISGQEGKRAKGPAKGVVGAGAPPARKQMIGHKRTPQAMTAEPMIGRVKSAGRFRQNEVKLYRCPGCGGYDIAFDGGFCWRCKRRMEPVPWPDKKTELPGTWPGDVHIFTPKGGEK